MGIWRKWNKKKRHCPPADGTRRHWNFSRFRYPRKLLAVMTHWISRAHHIKFWEKIVNKSRLVVELETQSIAPLRKNRTGHAQSQCLRREMFSLSQKNWCLISVETDYIVCHFSFKEIVQLRIKKLCMTWKLQKMDFNNYRLWMRGQFVQMRNLNWLRFEENFTPTCQITYQSWPT